MLRVDILLSKDDNVADNVINALQIELEKQITPTYPDAIIRVRVGSSKQINISGCAKDEKEGVLALIETVFYSDDWLLE